MLLEDDHPPGKQASTADGLTPLHHRRDIGVLLDQAIALHQGGELGGAEKMYSAILEIQPNDFDAMHLLGVIRYQQGRYTEAVNLIGSALNKVPRSAPALSNLAAALQRLDRYQEALEACERALAARPGFPDALYNRGNVLFEQKRYEEALASYNQTLAITPDHVEALCNRGRALKELGRLEESLNSYEQVLALKPESPDALYNYGALLQELKRFDAAIASYERALDIEPHHRLAFSALLNAVLHVCDWARAARIVDQCRAHIFDQKSWVEPFALLGSSDDPALHLQCAKNYVREKINLSPPLTARKLRPRRDRTRIAYLSADFREHATAYLTASLFELHDRTRFEVIGLSFGRNDDSAMRARLLRAFDQFHDIRLTSDAEAADLVETLEIDVLVDLMGYTGECRPGILARRPAPIQVNYLGFPGTMGADFIDYVIADPIVLPFDQQRFYTEKIVHLPECYQVNDPKKEITERTPTRQEVGLPDKAFVFCCFNNNYKIGCRVFETWMKLLAAVENSVLWLIGDNRGAADNLRSEAAARGIDPTRLVFAERRPLSEHLARHRLADLFLDTIPYNAHTTASDALWAGLPVLTSKGSVFGGRVAASLLTAIGLPELVTENLEAYEALALRLATQPELLGRIRTKLAQNRLSHPLFDANRFCRHIERAYAMMFDIWQRNEDPRSFAVEPNSELQATPPAAQAETTLNQTVLSPAGAYGEGDSNSEKTRREALVGTDLASVLDHAIAFHQNKQLVEAESLYLKILEAQPGQFDALHLLGIVRHQQGRDLEALDLIRSALTRNPRAASAWSNEGAVLHRLGRYADALASYDRALTIQPDDPGVLYNRGTALERLGRTEEALAGYEQVLAIRPDHAESLYNCGNSLMALKRLDEALTNYDRALAVKPDYVDAHYSRGRVLLALQRPDQALESFDQALLLRPGFAMAAFERGNALREMRRLDDAVMSYDRALETQPGNPLIWNNRGNVLFELHRLEDALASYDQALAGQPDNVGALTNRSSVVKELGRAEDALAGYDQALAIQPNYSDAVNNRGNALFELGRLDDAFESYNRSIQLDPDNAHYRFNRSLLLLLTGALEEGWREYEWRRKRLNWGTRTFDAPEWTGEPIPGKRLLLYCEQGLGDTIQFARFARMVAAASGAEVILEVQTVLGELLQSLEDGTIVVRRGEPLPHFDYHLPLLSVPLVLDLRPERDLAGTPYLSADPVRVNLWSNRLPKNGLRIGIAWQGNTSMSTDRRRSLALKTFAPLAAIPGVTLCSLQKGAGAEQLSDLPPGMVVETLGENFDTGPNAFLDTAAVMMSLDLIITCDTAVAHVAGALGRPVWILLRDAPDWRWLLDRQDTPWYPTARLFRQTRRGDWDGVLMAATAALRRLAEDGQGRVGRADDLHGTPALDDVGSLYRRAGILEEWGRHEEALATYDRVLAMESDHVKALHRRGILLSHLQRFEEALPSFDRALAISATDSELFKSRGYALWSLGRFEEALASYDQALANRANDPEALFNRAATLSELKRIDESLASYDQALQLQPRHAQALYGRGVILEHLGRLEEALESYNRALEVRPDYPEALNNCGSVLTKLGRLEEAVSMYTQALASRPDDSIARSNRANVLRRLGCLDDALANADRALEIQPEFAAGAYNRGVVLCEMRRFDDALASFDRAIALRPNYAEALCKRAMVFGSLGRLDEAIASFDKALAVRPDYAEAWGGRGNALKGLLRFDESLESFNRALETEPTNPWILNNRGNVFLKLRRFREALASYNWALAIEPTYVEALSNRSCALNELGQTGEALAGFEQALAVAPRYADAWYNRGNILAELGRYEEALASYDQALAIRPDYVEALCNRGCALKELGRPEEALVNYDRALAIRPEYADALNNRGCALLDLLRLEKAMASYDKSIALEPDHAEYHNNRSLLLLLLGEFDEGWREYEWRRKRTIWTRPQCNVPEWQGQPISRKRLLLCSEQGLGDTIQFARFVRLLNESGAHVILQVQPPLRGLMQSLDAEAVIVREGEALPYFDLHLPLMSVPFAAGFTSQTSLSASQYLSADPERVALWSTRLPPTGFRVGIAWQGNPKNLTDRQRSIPLRAFTRLGEVPGVQLISLQKSMSAQQIAKLAPRIDVASLGDKFDSGPDAFLDTAAVMMNLDLVITCDTAVAHLAGALGRPVWILLKHVPDWRWMLDREDSPWYPTARLFRQGPAGDWDDVMERVAVALASRAATPSVVYAPERLHTWANSFQ